MKVQEYTKEQKKIVKKKIKELWLKSDDRGILQLPLIDDLMAQTGLDKQTATRIVRQICLDEGWVYGKQA